MIQLRTFVFLDSLQPQVASYTATTTRGYLPIPGEASLWIEIAPGIDINRVTDIVQKNTQVKPGVQVVERRFGVLEIHSAQHDEVIEAGQQLLTHLDLEEKDRLTPKILTNEVISAIDPYQAALINRMRKGNMLIAGQTLFTLEVQPAVYTVFAANEAEKASPISLVDLQPIGAMGRLYLAGTDSQIAEAADAAKQALASISGKPTP
jgi:hypothetical protein